MWPTPTECSRTWRARKDGGSATGVPTVYRPGAGRRHFSARSASDGLAALVGSVVVDVEEVDARGDPEPRIDDDEASSSPAADDEGFEHVAACRRATLAEFYTMIQPALRQIAVDRVPMRASRLGAPPVAPPVQSTTSLEDDEDLCARLFRRRPGGGHAMRTQLLRGVLPQVALHLARVSVVPRATRGGASRGEQGKLRAGGRRKPFPGRGGDGGGDGEGVDASGFEGGGALPAVEDRGARRARVAYLMAKLREKGEGARDADTDASGHAPP